MSARDEIVHRLGEFETTLGRIERGLNDCAELANKIDWELHTGLERLPKTGHLQARLTLT